MGAAGQGRGASEVVRARRHRRPTRSCRERWSEGLGELTGHLIGDGWLTDVQTGWVYGGDDIADGMADSHEGLLRELIGGVSRQEMANGTVQLRAGSEAVREFFRGLGVTSARAHDKRVPEAIFTAPTEVQAAFLRGLFGADGCVSRVEGGGKANRYVGLGSRSNALLKDVQRMLSAFGIRGRIYRVTESREPSFSYTRDDGTIVEYASREGFDLRITGSDLGSLRGGRSASRRPRKQAALEAMLERDAALRDEALAPRWSRARTTGRRRSTTSPSRCITPTSSTAWSSRTAREYMHVDDSACNLASLNLMKFRRAGRHASTSSRSSTRSTSCCSRRRSSSARRATRPSRSASTRARSASSASATRTSAPT